ncbi:uncharacterized protein ACA1_189600 [Acanthamoeba castellanii str. Neff]|uniref:Translin family protein n=1 Tax=Acanthamoeba castellanii (strain ATCC 30010 / Neff) TaxID=1257118 RepID=L8GEJ7_ACACF|nr:uncharacterized protein ACA1_189600 [Acanthamoeba castellanii str. Neff]ELR11294.1 hypothetical protein ACA1_189600 [Acanthamoeba castellanii str. Neff]
MEGEEALGQPMGGEGGSRGRGRGGGRGGSRGGRGGRRPRASSESGEGGEASSKTANKKPRREIPKDSPILALFQSYSATLDDLNDRHERLVKLSRDLTIGSKRLIFLLQRNDERSALLQQADTDLAVILTTLEKIVAELQGTGRPRQEYWRYRRAFSPGLQEFIEAVSFLHYIKHAALITREEVEEVIRAGTPNHVAFFVNDEDYLLGIADLTGELMRKAIGAINAGEVEEAHAIRGFIQAIYEGWRWWWVRADMSWLAQREGFQQLTTDKKNDLRQKIGVMESSVKKVENACLALCIQGVEKLALLGTPTED